MNYPDADFAWFACDRDDSVAAFVTAGHGPVPHAIIGKPGVFEAEEVCVGMRERCEAESLLRQGNPASFLEIARRGVHVYDWQDIHRTQTERRGVYEAVARPARPCKLADLPADLAALVAKVRFDSLAFATSQAIDPRSTRACEQGHNC